MERPDNVVFVFGSNLAGRHGKGAALAARNLWGAEYGVGEGRTGNAYALPTKTVDLKPRSLFDIGVSIQTFISHANENPNTLFIFTAVGTGLAGYTVKEILSTIDIDILPMNIMFTPTWMKRLNNNKKD